MNYGPPRVVNAFQRGDTLVTRARFRHQKMQNGIIPVSKCITHMFLQPCTGADVVIPTYTTLNTVIHVIQIIHYVDDKVWGRDTQKAGVSVTLKNQGISVTLKNQALV